MKSVHNIALTTYIQVISFLQHAHSLIQWIDWTESVDGRMDGSAVLSVGLIGLDEVDLRR